VRTVWEGDVGDPGGGGGGVQELEVLVDSGWNGGGGSGLFVLGGMVAVVPSVATI